MSDFFTLGVSTLWRSLENIPGEEVHIAHRVFHEVQQSGSTMEIMRFAI